MGTKKPKSYSSDTMMESKADRPKPVIPPPKKRTPVVVIIANGVVK